MKILHVTTGNIIHRQCITDNAVADTAYAAVKDAMKDYQEYANDQSKVVTVNTGHGEASFRISQLIAVTCDDAEGSIEDIVSMALWEKKTREAVEAVNPPKTA